MKPTVFRVDDLYVVGQTEPGDQDEVVVYWPHGYESEREAHRAIALTAAGHDTPIWIPVDMRTGRRLNGRGDIVSVGDKKWVIGSNGRVGIQVESPDPAEKFVVYTEDQSYPNGFGFAVTWDVLPEDDPRISEDLRLMWQEEPWW